ncbi:MAG: right-handed parallel beta-helix repeat-containing protein [Candidatus Bathyarchaeota archaeon]|nr:right-handed parallel beta-helix repeat-containing protein [Candidatus Bathyarchaeota archaeon]
MKRLIKALLVILLLTVPNYANGQTQPITLQLTGNQQQTIQNTHYYVEGGLSLEDNASLTIINSTITFIESSDGDCSVMGNSILQVINSTIMLGDIGSIQASGNSSIFFTRSELHGTDENLYQTGIGASDQTKLNITDSKIGFIRITDTSTCTIQDSTINEFGSQSLFDPILTRCTIERITLVYENARVQVNHTLTGYHNSFNQSQLCKSGQTPYETKLRNTTLLYPPNIMVTDGKLEAHDTILDMVQIMGDSAIETQNTKLYYLSLMDYSWAFIDNSEIDYLAAWLGDFNIRLTNTTHRVISLYGTVGINFHTNNTETEQLILDWAQPNTAQNIQLHETKIDELELNMYSPTPIQCNDVTIGNITITAGYGDEPPITLTGSIDFTEDAELNQDVKEGYTRINRVYLIKAIIDEMPAPKTKLTIHTGNKTQTITTNQNGEAVLSLSYHRQIMVITDPQPGGPYMINQDNLTTPVTITLQDTNTTINILSDAPVTIKATTQTPTQTETPDWSRYTPAALLLAFIAIAAYLYNSKPPEEEDRQIQ